MILSELIGNTPLVEIQNLNPNKNVKIYCKLEGQNPGGSVKDRAAYGMIKGALDRGEISRGDKLVEATSGNTGIALAMVAQSMGIHMTLIMPDNSTKERVLTMKAYGAEVILTPAAKTIEYSRELSEEMAATDEYHMLSLPIQIITKCITGPLGQKSGTIQMGKLLTSYLRWVLRAPLWVYLDI